mmetsp:Transcript_88782/g.259479  ORF Transcript_88782/g.259479 Transcript_88782/m.259479 type:complete len:258 (-) Transcript_88782:2978-3751(-)
MYGSSPASSAPSSSRTACSPRPRTSPRKRRSALPQASWHRHSKVIREGSSTRQEVPLFDSSALFRRATAPVWTRNFSSPPPACEMLSCTRRPRQRSGPPACTSTESSLSTAQSLCSCAISNRSSYLSRITNLISSLVSTAGTGVQPSPPLCKLGGSQHSRLLLHVKPLDSLALRITTLLDAPITGPLLMLLDRSVGSLGVGTSCVAEPRVVNFAELHARPSVWKERFSAWSNSRETAVASPISSHRMYRCPCWILVR